MIEITPGKTYRRKDTPNAVTRVDWIGADGDIRGHTYVSGGTLSTACVIELDRFKTLIEPQST